MMSTVALDRLLAVLVLLIVATGGLTLRSGAPSAAWTYVIHGLLGGALLVAVVLKVARSSPGAAVKHRWARLAMGISVAVVALGALGGGFYWVASGRLSVIGPWTVLTIHALLGLALVPLLAFHLLPRRWRVLRPTFHAPPAAATLISRRSLLVGGTFAVASAAAYAAAAGLDRISGGERRFTGSRWLPAGTIPPPTTFLGEGTPRQDLATWRLSVRGRVAHRATYSLAALRALGERDVQAVLDCTSGWAVDTSWTGVPLSTVLDLASPQPSASVVIVRSITGWGAALGLEEARTTLLATGVAHTDLPLENGAPCRLVVPGRRGLDWVKWVAEIDVR
jgi:DMSO/TMAO reductase YedYZ molybdopterin-dependent catalytic subunit